MCPPGIFDNSELPDITSVKSLGPRDEAVPKPGIYVPSEDPGVGLGLAAAYSSTTDGSHVESRTAASPISGHLTEMHNSVFYVVQSNGLPHLE